MPEHVLDANVLMSLVPLQGKQFDIPLFGHFWQVLVLEVQVVPSYSEEELHHLLLVRPVLELPLLATDKYRNHSPPKKVVKMD